MATLTSSLVVRLIDQVTGPARAVSRSLLGLNNAANGNFGQRLGAAIERNNAALSAARGKLFDAAAGFYVLKNAIAGPVQAAMAFESAMADVRKVVDFPTPQAFKDFQTALVDMSKTVPLSVNGLAQIAAAAGQAGVASADLLRFTEAAAKIGVAFDISAEQAGDALPKLQNAIGLSLDEVLKLTDAMNYLSNAQASSAADILEVTTKVGSYAKQAGFSAVETAALASAMLSTGQEVDVVGTSIRNLGLYLTKGESATKSQRDGFKALGLEAKSVARNMQTDAMGTFADVIERINALPEYRRGAISSMVFGNEARALGPLIANTDLLSKSVALVANESDYAGSAMAEFQVRSKTFANAVQILNNRFTALKIMIGNALIPALNDLINVISPLIDRVAQFAQAHPELVRNVMAAAAALIAFKVASASLTFVGLLGRGGALSMLSLGYNTLGKAIIGASAAAKGAVGLQMALAAMSGGNMGGMEKMLVALRGMAIAIPGVAGLGTALGVIGGALAAVSAPVWAGIAVGVAAVAGAAFMLWKYWDRVSSVVGGFVGKLAELAVQIPGVQPALDGLGAVGRLIGDGFGLAVAKLQEFGNWIGSFFQQEVLTDEQKAAWANAGANAAQGLVDSAKAVVMGLVEWFKGLPGMIMSAIGSIDIGSLIKWPALPSWLGGAQEPAPAAAAPPSGHRATGGNVWPGGSFIVGEGGEEEVFRPKTAGTITPASKMGGGAQITFGDIIVHGSADPVATANAVAAKIESRVAALLRGAHSDSEAWA